LHFQKFLLFENQTYILSQKKAVNTNVTDRKNTPNIPKFRKQTLLAVCTTSMSWCLRSWRKYVQKTQIRL